jgi:hypothetical protein
MGYREKIAAKIIYFCKKAVVPPGFPLHSQMMLYGMGMPGALSDIAHAQWSHFLGQDPQLREQFRRRYGRFLVDPQSGRYIDLEQLPQIQHSTQPVTEIPEEAYQSDLGSQAIKEWRTKHMNQPGNERGDVWPGDIYRELLAKKYPEQPRDDQIQGWGDFLGRVFDVVALPAIGAGLSYLGYRQWQKEQEQAYLLNQRQQQIYQQNINNIVRGINLKPQAFDDIFATTHSEIEKRMKPDQLQRPIVNLAVKLVSLDLMNDIYSDLWKNNPQAINQLRQNLQFIKNYVLATNFEMIESIEHDRIKRGFDKRIEAVDNARRNGSNVVFTFYSLMTDKNGEETIVKAKYMGKDNTGARKTVATKLALGEVGVILESFNSRAQHLLKSLERLENYVTNADHKKLVSDFKGNVQQLQERIGNNIHTHQFGVIDPNYPRELAEIAKRIEEYRKTALELRKQLLPEFSDNRYTPGLAALNEVMRFSESPFVEHRGVRILVLDGDIAKSRGLTRYPAVMETRLSLESLAVDRTSKFREAIRSSLQARSSIAPRTIRRGR